MAGIIIVVMCIWSFYQIVDTLVQMCDGRDDKYIDCFVHVLLIQ